MNRYWVLGLIIAIVAVACLARLVRRTRKSPASPKPVDLPLWDADQHAPLEPASNDDDTTPAVLSPPEFKPPQSSNGRNR